MKGIKTQGLTMFIKKLHSFHHLSSLCCMQRAKGLKFLHQTLSLNSPLISPTFTQREMEKIK
jgi:hypothetical protein